MSDEAFPVGARVKYNADWLRQQRGHWLEKHRAKRGTVCSLVKDRRYVAWDGLRTITAISSGLLEEAGGRDDDYSI